MAAKAKTEAETPTTKDGEDGKRDIVREQETATKSAQELVQERHMNPQAFG